MKASSIKKYLRPSSIMGRKSTFANAFASALAPHDIYTPDSVAEALLDLDQDPKSDLQCVYCGAEAATWDHVFNRVVKGEFSGHGHRIRNLVPCCRTCNESKGQKPWYEFLEARNPPDKEERRRRMERFLGKAHALSVASEADENLERFRMIRSQVFDLMAEADRLAAVIRQNTVKRWRLRSPATTSPSKAHWTRMLRR